jgi:transcriptional regulator with XRE-family HTH domain
MAPSRLIALIDAHKQAHGVSDAELARRIGMTRENLRLWRANGLRRLPGRANLVAVAEVIGKPYRTVLNAALIDTEYLHDTDVEAPALYRDLLYATLGVLTDAQLGHRPVPQVGQTEPWEAAYAAQSQATYQALSDIADALEKHRKET